MNYPDDVPVLSDGVVTLRAHTPGDLERMYEMARDPEMLRWTTVPDPYSREDAQGYLEVIERGWTEMNHRGWAIEAEGLFVGNIDVRGLVAPTIGFGLHPDARGKGYMVRAIELAAQWSFTEGGVEAIHWQANVGNEASLRAAHAAGFTLVATIPAFLDHRGVATDAWVGVRKFGDKPGPKTTWTAAPVLEGERVRLRALRMDDAQRIYEACSDPLTQHWLSALKNYTLSDAYGFVNRTIWHAARGAKVSWAICAKDSDDLLGHIAVGDMDTPGPSSGEIGYWMHPEARGKGLMTEAAQLVANYARDPQGLDLTRVTLWAVVENEASNKIAEKIGFAKIGIEHRADRLADGNDADLVAWEIVKGN